MFINFIGKHMVDASSSSYDRLFSLIQDVARALKLETEPWTLTRPKNMLHGDWSTNIAMVGYQANKSNYASPLVLAEEILARMEADSPDFIETISLAHPGYINFKLTPPYFIQSLKGIIAARDQYGSNLLGKDKTAIVEYSSPNIAKPFTIGHLRSTVIGDAIANLLAFSGWKVLRDNHLGDWGTQFGKQLYAIDKLGKGSREANIAHITSAINPVKELVSLYVEFHEKAEADESLNEAARVWFQKLEAGDEEARTLWKQCIDWSWDSFSKLYEILEVNSFDDAFDHGRGLGESFFEDKMAEPIEQLRAKQLLRKGDEGAELVFFKDDVLPPAMIVKKDGSTLYHTRDLAADWYRKQVYNPDLIINEVGAEQQLYFQQLFAMEVLLGWYTPEQRVHVMHGMFRFADKKMSTRKGRVIWLEDVIAEATERALQLQEVEQRELAQKVAIGALKYNDLKGAPKRDIVFDWDVILTMKGNSGPYLQYAYARAVSILRSVDATIHSVPLDYTPNMDELRVAKLLERFPEVIVEAVELLSPHVVCTYLYELAQAFNGFYAHHRIIGSETQPVPDDAHVFRVTLTQATAIVLSRGLRILGVPVLDAM